MVRAGVVEHPGQWKTGGFHELLSPKARYGIISHEAVYRLLNVSNQEELGRRYRQWLDEILAKDRALRQGCWTEGLAVGDSGFVSEIKERFGALASSRSIEECGSGPTVLREKAAEYRSTAPTSPSWQCLERPFEG